MKKYFTPFVVLYVIYIVIISTLVIIIPKIQLHLLLNKYHNTYLDTFFAYYSRLAELPLFIIGLLPLLFWKAGITYLYAISEVTNGIILYIIKTIVNAPRPLTVFQQEGLSFPIVQGVHLHSYKSFPSGHTSSFFVFFTILALVASYYFAKHYKKQGINNIIITLCLVLAILGGYSRIYLSQHFLIDVLGGSLLGFATPCLYFYYFYKKDFFNTKWFNYCLIKK